MVDSLNYRFNGDFCHSTGNFRSIFYENVINTALTVKTIVIYNLLLDLVKLSIIFTV